MYYVAKDFCFAICACAQMLCSTDTFIYLFIYLPYKSTFSTEHYRLYLTHPVNFPCGRKPEYPEKTHDLPQSIDLCSFHMRTGFESQLGFELATLRPFSINVRFARAGEAFIVMDSRHARVSRFSKPAPPARAKRLQ